MSFFIQSRSLKKAARQELASIGDLEKRGNSSSDGSTLQGDYYSKLPSVEARDSDDGSKVFVVSWSSDEDPNNPRNWSTAHRLKILFSLILIAFVVTAGSSIESAVQEVAAEAFGVAEVTEALGGTGIFLVGFGIGALIASPLSELIGRFWVYLGSLVIFGIWEMASALSPNIGAQIAFRFLAGLSASAPLTVAGGSISDIFTVKEKTWAFPIFAIVGFGGPILGPVMAAYIPVTNVLSFRWADWIILITDGLVLFTTVMLSEETLAPRILKRKAAYFRKLTGDDRFKSEDELGGESLGEILKKNFTRPFLLGMEPIVIACAFYLTIIYIVLFTFLDGYTYIFEMTYGINTGLSNIIFVGLFVGVLLSFAIVFFVMHVTNKQLARDGDDGSGSKIDRESRLLFAMCGAPLVPVGLFWLAWTDFASISIWSPILATVLIGVGIISIFMSSYMYIIDAYEVYAASALTFTALVRYLAAGGMTVVGVPMYRNLGTHYALTILACISAAAVPIPYALYKWGPRIRARSQYAVQTDE